MAAVKPDKLTEQVTKVIEAIAGKKPLRIILTINGLAKFEPNKVLAELSIQIDDIIDGADRDALLEAAELPADWKNPHEIMDAVNANDHADMFEAFGMESGSPATLYSPVFNLAAALKVARAKL